MSPIKNKKTQGDASALPQERIVNSKKIYRNSLIDSIRDTLATSLRSLGFPCRTEVRLPGTELVPADIFIPTLAEDSPTAVDVSVVHPLQPSHSAQATVSAGMAAEARAVSKVAMYGAKCSARSWAYTAFVADTTGSWNQAAQRLVGKLARVHSLRTGEVELASSLWLVLARALAQTVGKQLVRARSQDEAEVAPLNVVDQGGAPIAVAY